MKLALILPAAGLAIGLAVAFSITPIYESSVRCNYQDYSRPDAPTHTTVVDRFVISKGRIESAASLSNLIQTPHLDLYPEERRSEPIEDTIDRMKKSDLHIELLSASERLMMFRIAFRYRDPAKTQSALSAVFTRFQEEGGRIANEEKDVPAHTVRLSLIDAPELPTSPIYPNRVLIALIGLGAGLLAAVIVSIMRCGKPAPVPTSSVTA